jgi:DNA-binding transcriptional LysR family regulator
MTDLNSLAIFAKVVELNSFSEAARTLQIPVSTVSRRIAELEDQLGVRLLERSTRLLRVSDIGLEVFEQAREASLLREEVDNLVSNTMREVEGVLRLSAPPSLSDCLLAPLVGAFQASYPNVRVQILVSPTHLDNVSDDIDLAIRVGEVGDPSLISRKLLTYRHRLLASPAYLAGKPAPTHPDELRQHRLIAFSKGPREREWIFKKHATGEVVNMTFLPHLAINDYVGIGAALMRHAGIGDLPPIVMPHLFASGELVEVMPEWHARVFDLWLVHLPKRQASRTVRIFMEFAAQVTPSLFPALPA